MESKCNLLITGVTGFMGKTLARALLDPDSPHAWKYDKVVGIARRWKDTEDFYREFGRSIKIHNGDVRDRGFLHGIRELRSGRWDVIHTAAYKHGPLAEENPREAASVNIDGTKNVLDLPNIRRFVLISTDKACDPIGVYGQTKAIAERIVLNARGTVLRFGNVWGSTGSVVSYFHSLLKAGATEIPVTDRGMTRYFFPQNELADYIFLGTDNRGLIIPKLKSTGIGHLAMAFIEAYAPNWKERAHISITGTRPGEKMHEAMISAREATRAWDVIADNVYRTTGSLGQENGNGTHDLDFLMSSQNAERFTFDELVEMIEKDI